MNHFETSSENSDPTPDTIVNQPAVFGLGLCDTEAMLTQQQQVELDVDLEQLARERRLAQTALMFTHS